MQIRRVMWWIFGTVVAVLLFAAGCFWWLGRSAEGRLYYTAERVPKHRVAMVLGTTKSVNGRWLNTYFVHRMNAAIELYRSGRVTHLLLSGDNGQKAYNEPVDMLNYLTKRGIPARDITLDYAGFRTLDSVVRAHKVFGQQRLVIISQDWHLERALFIADKFGIDAVGFVADNYPDWKYSKPYWREYGARVKAVLDLYVLNKSPKYLGKPEVIK